jgi:small-conductance mechanosensitive channel
MRRAVLLVVVIGLGVVTISSAARNNTGPTPQQDVIRVEQRVNQLEQRLFSMETTLRNIEQQSRLATVNRRGVADEDVAQLRSELLVLQRRAADYECALAKLDERTLSPAMRTARRKSGSDSCRVNSETPIQLPGSRQ